MVSLENMIIIIEKKNRILLISLQILVKSFVSNILIDISSNLYILSSIYIINTFQNCLKWVIYINTLYL